MYPKNSPEQDIAKQKALEEMKRLAAQHLEEKARAQGEYEAYQRSYDPNLPSSKPAPVQAQKKPKSKLIPILIIVVILVLVCFFGAVAFFVIFNPLNLTLGENTSTNLGTGQTTASTDLDFEESYIKIGGERTSTTQIEYGKKIEIVIDGVSGFTEVDGNIFPAMAIDTLDSNGQSLLSAENILESYADTGLDSANDMFFATLTVGDPLVAGEDYKIKITITDLKNPGDAKIVSELDISVTAPVVALPGLDENAVESDTNGLFSPAKAIVSSDLEGIGVTSAVSLESEMAVKDLALGTADTYTYTVEDCDFVVRDYVSDAEAIEGFTSFRNSYSAGLFASANWEVKAEGLLGENSFEGTKDASVRPIFQKTHYLFETTGWCNKVMVDEIRSIASIVYEKIN
ncbi:MAG: hypothetical protein AABW59_04410 [archaeon]